MTGGLGPALAALKFHRFPGDDFRNKAPGVCGVGIEDPGHVLGIGPDIGCHNIDFRPDEGCDFLGEATRQSLLLGHAEFAGVASDAAFAPAIGKAHEGTFPVHPHCEGGNFTDVDLGVKAEAAFDGAA